MTSQAALKIELASDDNGQLDYDVIDHPVLRRAKVPKHIRIGEQFNVYHGESSKGGAVWRGSMEKSLLAWLDTQAPQVKALKPKNDAATGLLSKLAELGHLPEPGYWAGRNYCVGVYVADAAEAFRLGSTLGDSYGSVILDHLGRQQYIVFSDALVSW